MAEWRWHAINFCFPSRTVSQSLFSSVLQVAMNSVELAFGFELDFQLGNVKVFGVTRSRRRTVYINSAMRGVTFRVSASLATSRG